jgi:L-ornithine Nalpha-acyltransferase
MTVTLRKGRYAARLAENDADVTAAQALRHLCFVVGAGRMPLPDGLDRDGFDPICKHVLVEDGFRRLVACFRLLPLASGAEIGRSYAAQYYDLTGLREFAGPVVEMGRFCVHPGVRDPDVLRVAWGAVTRFVDAAGVELLFGCSSFAGIEPGIYRDAFGLLQLRHLAPDCWRPGVKADDIVRFGDAVPDRRQALLTMPPLLRTYLGMGGWVSDHAVVDRAMNTLHVFTGVEIAAIPVARARALRAVAG